MLVAHLVHLRQDTPLTVRPPTPRLGAAGPAILAELGYSNEQIADMIATGAIGRTEWARG
jgi:crotonobetainyl-CoA:carnitine CoA-transferase CaiB-like acyl-CoA transferase